MVGRQSVRVTGSRSSCLLLRVGSSVGLWLGLLVGLRVGLSGECVFEGAGQVFDGRVSRSQLGTLLVELTGQSVDLIASSVGLWDGLRDGL